MLAQAPPSNDLRWQPTTELNKELPKWFAFDGSYRIRTEDLDGIGFKNVSDTHALGQLQLGFKVKPVAWLRFYVQTQDSRMYWKWPVAKAPPYQNTWDVHQLWGEIGDIETYHFSVRVCCQELAFGEFVQGEIPTKRCSFLLKGMQIDSFASSVVNSVDGSLDHHKQGNPFYGLYGKLAKIVPKATYRTYVFWRLAPVGFTAPTQLDLKVIWTNRPSVSASPVFYPSSLTTPSRWLAKNGTLGVDSIGARAGHWNVGRTFSVKYSPRVLGEYNYASGTANPTGTKISTFDQLYPSGHDKFGVADQVGWRNIRDLRTGVQFKPVAKLNMSGIYHDLGLAEARDGLYASNGSVAVKSLSGAAGHQCWPRAGFARNVQAQPSSVWARLRPHHSRAVPQVCDAGQVVQLSLRDFDVRLLDLLHSLSHHFAHHHHGRARYIDTAGCQFPQIGDHHTLPRHRALFDERHGSRAFRPTAINAAAIDARCFVPIKITSVSIFA